VGSDRRDPTEAEGDTFGVGTLVRRRRSRHREHRAEDDPRLRRVSARAISGAISRARRSQPRCACSEIACTCASAPQILWVSGNTGMCSRITRSPRPAGATSSKSPVASPPSVGSCIACTDSPTSAAARAALTTLIPGSIRKRAARARRSASTCPRSRSAFSRARMAVPSIAHRASAGSDRRRQHDSYSQGNSGGHHRASDRPELGGRGLG
jgi:hypothetical protein